MYENLSDYDYQLPPELIAQKPSPQRDGCRLLVLDKKSGQLSHDHFYNLLKYLRPGDLLVLNDSRVLPARLLGRKAASGGQAEILLNKKSDNLWECLVGGRVKEGGFIEVLDKKGNVAINAKVVKKLDGGACLVDFALADDKFLKIVEDLGHLPLPPYIRHGQDEDADRQDYQTVFADPEKTGSVAAPTAGLHFTEKLLEELKSAGINLAYVTLHVGLGTFSPVKSENINDHKMHSEYASISRESAAVIRKAKSSGQRIIAVGTTSCRTLESMDINKDEQSFWTDIFIHPGYNFKVVDGLVTNFHLPKSSLIMLVSALASKENIDRAYQEAIAEKYRFFSYGDAMLIS